MDLLQSFLMLTPLERRKKRKQFRESLFAAVDDGKLTEDEILQLERDRDQFGMTEEDIRPIRVQLYQRAYGVTAADKHVTEEEWTDMLKIQQFLGIKDEEVAPTKKELLRLHILREVTRGNLPVIDVKGLALTRGEAAHWAEKGIARIHKQETPAEMIVTNKRVVVRGKEPLVIRMGRIVDIGKISHGVAIADASGGRMVFLPADQRNAAILRAVLSKAVAAHGA